MFSVRLVKADYYMSTPIPGLDARYSEFRGVEVKQVPVIRIFGSTGLGQKVCLHLHGVFPYIYIPYDGCIEKEKFVYQIASAVDKALNVSLGNSNSRTQHVYKVTHVSAVPFYGYHSQNHQFLKIYFYNPVMIKKASDLLQNGVILGQVFQPHEAHIPFVLQFCMDYNLHGQLTSNPGLKAIWDEEKERRRKENRNSQFTPQSTQIRQTPQTASEKFHLGRLKKRLSEVALLVCKFAFRWIVL
ncbi:Uncharacterized protein GBIM_12682 [Gryllus bimaculatus]|nr:Uncharacterized protein GBIM_12682 [Gryllus bimaculatus]